VAGRRQFVSFAVKRDLSQRAACRLVRVSRRRLSCQSRRLAKDAAILARLKTLAAKHPSYGVRMLWAKLRQDGTIVNRKRVRRLCRCHGLLLKQKRRRKRRGIGVGVPCRAEFPNHVWAYDFLEDRTKTGRKLRVLTVEDEFTRQCIEIEVEHRMNAAFVGKTLVRLFKTQGVPRFIRSDNGSEFIARSLMEVLRMQSVRPYHIEPGSPWQNGFDERFNGTYRSDCADQHTFHNCLHARVLSKAFKDEYNQQRPHSSLKYLTPSQFAEKWNTENTGTNNARTAAPADELLDLSHCTLSAKQAEKKADHVNGRPLLHSDPARRSGCFPAEPYPPAERDHDKTPCPKRKVSARAFE